MLKRYSVFAFSIILIPLLTGLAFSQDPGEPDTAIVECLEYVRPNSRVILNVYTVNDSALIEFQIPLAFPDTVTNLDITCDSISFVGTRAVSATMKSDSASIDNDKNRLVVFAVWFAGSLPPGNVGDGPVAKIYFTTGPTWDSTQYVLVDTMMWPPSIDLRFLPQDPEGDLYLPAFVEGCLGTGQLSRNDTLIYTAYSPVDLIVTDPNGDSIGVDFNTIPEASYDTTTDVNQDGDKDDKVIIPNPLIGVYLVKVIAEPGPGEGNYTLSVKVNGNEETPMVLSGTAPGPEEVDSVFYPVTEYLRGDPNSDGSKSVSDVVFLINYLFKGGPEPLPDPVVGDVNEDGDVTVADVVYLINYLFKGGPPPTC